MTRLFVPGRLCLFGEHSDWASGLARQGAENGLGACIVCGTDQGISASVEAAANFEFVVALSETETRRFQAPMTPQALRAAAQAADFFSYAAGTAAVVQAGYRTSGVRIVVTSMDLPMQRGLSSSAAACVLVARAFNHVYQLGLGVREEMELAYCGEIAAGSQCGRMDQACAFGKVPVLLRFVTDTPEVTALAVGARLHFLIVDLCAHKDTRRILADLHSCFGGESTPLRARLRCALGEKNARIVDAARVAIERGEAASLGRLMVEAQALFDRDVAPACPAELTAPQLHRVLAAPAASDLVWGGKGVGSQGDGAAQFLCRGESERRELKRYLTADFEVECLDLTIEATLCANG